MGSKTMKAKESERVDFITRWTRAAVVLIFGFLAIVLILGETDNFAAFVFGKIFGIAAAAVAIYATEKWWDTLPYAKYFTEGDKDADDD